MFDAALVALDLAPSEQPILDCLPDLQRWGVRRVVLTHVIQVGYMHGATTAHQGELEAWLETLASPLRKAGLEVLTSVRASGVPAAEILAAADQHAVDLIVIGSRGHTLIGRLLLGSVARAVIRATTRPVLLEWVEPTAAGTREACEAVCTDTLRHVLFATDFSANAALAEAAALHLAAKAGRVDCVHVIDERDDDADPAAANAGARIDALVKRIEAAGGHGNGIVLQGRPASEIARHAGSHGASLIVVGKHGQSALASLLIGSTAENLCEIAGRPVLMVP
jgi:nucleotide-binding universal stress UspA family protein